MSLRINQQLRNPEGIARLLERIKDGLSVRSPDYISANTIFYLDKDFTIEGTAPFQADQPIIINPNAKKSGEIADKGGAPQSLTLFDVFLLLNQAYAELYDPDFNKKYVSNQPNGRQLAFFEHLKETKDNYLATKAHEIESGNVTIPNKEELLTEIVESLAEAIEALFAEGQGAEEKKEDNRTEEIPEWLKAALEEPLRDKKHWKLIAEIIKPKEDKKGFLEIAIDRYRNIQSQNRADFPGIQLKTKEELISIVALRKFLNEWAEKILEEDTHDPFRHFRFTSEADKNLIFFPVVDKGTAVNDLELVQDLDVQAVRSFKEWLLLPLEEYEDKEDGEHVNGTEHEDGGGDEGDDKTEKKKADLPKTDQEKEELIKNLNEHQAFVRQETLRLQTIATNFVLSFNNLPTSLGNDLLGTDKHIFFEYFEREINSEIMEMLSRNGDALNDENRRAQITRQFLFRLMANPKFQAHLALLREKYIDVQIDKQNPDIPAEERAELKKQLLEDLIQHPKADVNQLLTEVYSAMKVSALAGLTETQEKQIREELVKKLNSNPRLNVDAFLTDTFAAVKVASGVGGLSAGQQVELTTRLKAGLAKNPKASIDDLLKQLYAEMQASASPLTDAQQAELRKQFQGRFSTNPLDRIELILNEIYASVPNLSDAQKNTLRQQLTAGLSRNAAVNIDEIIKGLSKELPASDPNKAVFNTGALTKDHFLELLKYYDLTPEQQNALFEGVDLLMFMRVSPERISRFTSAQLIEIFGVDISQLPKNHGDEFVNILTSYFMLRRQWFEKEYNSASVSQAQDIIYNDRALTDEELKLLLEQKAMIKKSGLGAKHFVRASVLTKAQVANFKSSGHAEAEETEVAANLLQENRKRLYIELAKQFAEQDEEYRKYLMNQVGVHFNDANFLNLIETSMDMSPFEYQSGVVTNEDQQVIHSAAQAEQNYAEGKKAGFSNTALSAVADEGAALLGSAAANAVLPGVGFFIPKSAKKTIGKAVAIGGAVVGGGAVLALGQLVSQFGAVGGSAIFFGAVGGVFGGVFGAIGGAIAGAGFGAALQSSGIGLSNLTGGAGGAVASTAATPAATAAAPSLAAKAAGAIRSVVSSPAGVAVTGFVGVSTVGSVLVYTQLTTAFLPPIVQTTTEYASVTKTATPSKAAQPTTVNYTVNISANPTYKIEITDITDTIVAISKDPNNHPATPPPVDLSKYKTTLDSAGTASTNITYSVPFDSSYVDSLVTNTFTIKYTVTDAGVTSDQVTSATATTCFGDCPAPKVGCWPASGLIWEGPYESPQSTHNHPSKGSSVWVFLDAVDISNGTPQPVPIYTPFDGTASFYTYNQTTGEGAGGNYGNRVAVRTSTGAVLLFAHFERFMPTFQPGQSYPVHAGDQLGFMGTTGNAGPGVYGKHLHYEYRPAKTGAQGGAPSISNLSLLLPEPVQYTSKWQVTRKQRVVTTCNGTAATP